MTLGTAQDLSSQVVSSPMTSFGMRMNSPHGEFQRISPQKRMHTSPIAFESGQFSSLFGMVAAGVGISLVPEMAIDRNAGCRYVRLSDTRATRTVVAAILRGRSFNRVQQAFLSGIKD
jgi:DNA-binding transcriptional LysR family regulator